MAQQAPMFSMAGAPPNAQMMGTMNGSMTAFSPMRAAPMGTISGPPMPAAIPIAQPTPAPPFGRIHPGLVQACIKQSMEELIMVLAGSPNMQETDEVGWTVLHYAARLGNIDLLRIVMDSGGAAVVNQADQHGDTPLHIACSEGHIPVVPLLLQAQASPNIRNSHGNTPLHYACFWWCGPIVQMLCQARGNINIPNNENQTAVMVSPERFRNAVYDMFAMANGLPTMQQRMVAQQQQMMQAKMQQQQMAMRQQEMMRQRQAGGMGSSANTTGTAAGGAVSPAAAPAEASGEKKPWEIDYKDIKREKFIGKGGFGEVWLGEWQGTKVAIKTVLAQKISEKALVEFRAEVDILSKLRHPNITLFMGACLDPEKMCVMTEFMDHGSLYAVLHDKKIDITWKMLVRMATEAARGMNYLHCFKPCIMHRDLKSLNLLVDQHWTVKVTDFGLSVLKEAKGQGQDAEGGSTQQCGTPQWMAPELLRNEKYDEKADVYSFGIVLWEMYTRQDPYHGMNPMQVGMKVLLEHLRPPIPHHCPHLLQQLITECWHDDPRRRPTFAQILDKLKIIKDRTVS